ncbi:MAG: phosphotriesterase family protein [Agriterribacter sp.]
MKRSEFIRSGIALSVPLLVGYNTLGNGYANGDYIMTVNGPIDPSKLGFTLSHEHILVDFIGADKVSPDRYNQEEVFNTALPFLKQCVKNGGKAMVECTPEWLGRDAVLLQKLSAASGLHIITNTGYYGAAKEKFLPGHAYTDSAKQLAARWIDEWKNGIKNTGIRPGYIKSGVDAYPLSDMQHKLVEAAALTHLATGLTFGIHTGNGKAALEEMKIIEATGVKPSAWVWIHAQSEADRAIHISIAKRGGWLSFDGFNKNGLAQYISFLKDMKAEGLLNKALVSHDAGWYDVGKAGGGNYRSYNEIFTDLLPALRKEGFTEGDIQQVFVKNPATALAIKT